MKRMPKTKQRSTASTNDGAPIGYETRRWHMTNTLHGRMDTAEDKHGMLGLNFLQDISDAFKATDGGVFRCFGGNKCE
jgi:hypothetical protein